MDLKSRINELNNNDLTDFIKAVDYPLSGYLPTEAFKIFAEIESIAISIYKHRQRHKMEPTNNE